MDIKVREDSLLQPLPVVREGRTLVYVLKRVDLVLPVDVVRYLAVDLLLVYLLDHVVLPYLLMKMRDRIKHIGKLLLVFRVLLLQFFNLAHLFLDASLQAFVPQRLVIAHVLLPSLYLLDGGPVLLQVHLDVFEFALVALVLGEQFVALVGERLRRVIPFEIGGLRLEVLRLFQKVFDLLLLQSLTLFELLNRILQPLNPVLPRALRCGALQKGVGVPFFGHLRRLALKLPIESLGQQLLYRLLAARGLQRAVRHFLRAVRELLRSTLDLVEYIGLEPLPDQVLAALEPHHVLHFLFHVPGELVPG